MDRKVENMPNFDRYDICIGHFIAACEWGDYQKIARLNRMGLRVSSMEDSHSNLIGKDDLRNAHAIYHVVSKRYAER